MKFQLQKGCSTIPTGCKGARTSEPFYDQHHFTHETGKKHHGISWLSVCQSLVFAFLQNYGMMLRYAAAIILGSGKAFFNNSIEIKAAGLYFSADVVIFSACWQGLNFSVHCKTWWP